MESLQLPVWMEKILSTATPVVDSSSASLSDTEEYVIFDDDSFADQFLNSIPTPDGAPEHLMEQDVKEEISRGSSPLSSLVDESSPKNTEELLFEFDAVCSAVGLNLSPASPAKALEGAPIYYVVQGEEVEAAQLMDSDDFLDELVRSHSSCIPDDLLSEASPGSSPTHSEISSDASSPRSDTSYDVSGFFDEEWTPAPKEKGPEKRKKRPYGRPAEEKKVRKKEQNKNAATRYRQKKKQALEEVLREEDQLKAIHSELQTKFADTKREISYLKSLMREILVAKGVLV